MQQHWNRFIGTLVAVIASPFITGQFGAGEPLQTIAGLSAFAALIILPVAVMAADLERKRRR